MAGKFDKVNLQTSEHLQLKFVELAADIAQKVYPT